MGKYIIESLKIIEIQDFGNCIELTCGVIQKDLSGRLYTTSNNRKTFIYPATEEYRDYFMMFAQNEMPIEFNDSNFEEFFIDEDVCFVVKSLANNTPTAAEQLMSRI